MKAVASVIVLILGLAQSVNANIVLTNFTLAQTDGNVLITWTTASETGNDFFSIERTTDGINYTAVGSIDGAGTCAFTNEYSYSDEHPAVGVNYYRLRQTNVNGSSETITTQSIEVKITAAATVFPNPCTNGQVQVQVATEGVHEISILNAAGQVQYATQIVADGPVAVLIQLPLLENGVYYVAIHSTTGRTVQQVIVQ